MAGYFEEMNWTPHGAGGISDFMLEVIRHHLQDLDMWEELRVSKKLPPAASKQAVDNLKELIANGDREGEQCPVCLNQFVRDDVMKVLPCDHKFHPGCILPWLGKTNSCPLCRYELPTDDEEYEKFRKEKERAKQREEDIKTLHDSMFT